jgi:hypothetical protein
MTTPINTQFAREKWLPALRSGEWEQGRQLLRVPQINEDEEETGAYSYCCLGVACELLKDQGVYWGVAEYDDNNMEGYTLPGYGYALDNFPITKIGNMIGLAHEGVITYPDGTIVDLAHLNDEDELTFPEIADEIERVVEAWEAHSGN